MGLALATSLVISNVHRRRDIHHVRVAGAGAARSARAPRDLGCRRRACPGRGVLLCGTRRSHTACRGRVCLPAPGLWSTPGVPERVGLAVRRFLGADRGCIRRVHGVPQLLLSASCRRRGRTLPGACSSPAISSLRSSSSCSRRCTTGGCGSAGRARRADFVQGRRNRCLHTLAGFALGRGTPAHFAARYRGVARWPQLMPAVASGLIFVMFSYSGWNAAAYIGGEIRNPQRNLPRALIIGTPVVIAFTWP